MLYYIMNCRLVDCEKNFVDDVLIKNGKIKRIGKDKIRRYLYEYKQKYNLPGLRIRDREKVEEIDGRGMILMPSFADLHFHMRHPGQEQKETLETGNRAALRGGYTHMVAMANTKPVVDSGELAAEVIRQNDALGLCKLYQVCTVTKGMLGKEVVDFEQARKVTRFFSDDGRNIDDPAIMEKALSASKEYDFVLMDHSEEETEMVRRNVEIAKRTGGNLHLCHVSKKASMEAIIAAKEQGYTNVTVEVTPHHLYAFGLDYRVNPPFAQEEDRRFLIEAIRGGYVDAIATDHAPHTAEDKEKGAPGISGIETSLGLTHRVFLENDLDMKTLSRLMSYQPMKFLGEGEHKIEEGLPADLTLIEEGRFCIDRDSFLSKGKNTPFDQEEVRAQVVFTMKEGKILYR